MMKNKKSERIFVKILDKVKNISNKLKERKLFQSFYFNEVWSNKIKDIKDFKGNTLESVNILINIL